MFGRAVLITERGCIVELRRDGRPCALPARRGGISGPRAVWIAQNGPLDPSKKVFHRCSTPGCVRLDHLRVAWPKEPKPPKSIRTHCRCGTELTTSTSGRRYCRTCLRERQRRRRARLREEQLRVAA